MEQENDKKNLTKSDIFRDIEIGMDYEIETLEKKREKDEQIRTKTKKKIFLQIWEKSSGVIRVACDKAGISRETFYEWIKSDKQFNDKVEEMVAKRNSVAEDILWGLISIKKHAPSVHYYLDRRHPDYKPRSQTEVVVGDRTFEDVIKEQEEKVRKDQEEWDKKYGNKKPNTAKTGGRDEQVNNTKDGSNQGQEGKESAVQVKPGAEVLLEEKDKEEHNTQSAPKGDNKDN